jgi:hypothetical protein
VRIVITECDGDAIGVWWGARWLNQFSKRRSRAVSAKVEVNQ